MGKYSVSELRPAEETLREAKQGRSGSLGRFEQVGVFA